MAKNSFLLVNLQEDQTKHLAQVITNDSCRKILDYLAEKPATESELSIKLSLPLSTVHYNMQALLKVGLIDAEEFHYSSKGREVLHYKLANKYIIIAPKTTYGIKEKLKSILPVAGIMAGGALVIAWLSKVFSRGIMASESTMAISSQIAEDIRGGTLSKAAETTAIAASAAPEALSAAAVQSTTSTIPTTTTTTLPKIVSQAAEPSIALWFLIGGIVAIMTYLLADYFIYKKSRK